MQIKNALYCLVAIVVLATKLNAQVRATFLNRVFQDGSGSPVFNPILNPLGLVWSKSIHTTNGDLVTVGHTSVGGQEDIYVVRYDPDGNVVFQQSYDVGSLGYNDYGTDIYEAANTDFIICGMTDNGTINNYDVVVLRINAAGTLIASGTRDGPSSKNDFAVSIIEDGSGYIYVAANAENSFYDYWLIKWDSGLNFNNENFYNYINLSDIAIGIELDPGSSEVRLIGASASGTNSCDYAIARFDVSTLSFLGDGRSSLPGVALDRALAFVRDANNNTFITGQAWNGTNFDIKTVEILANMTIAWTATMDVHSFDDAGTTIALDPLSGNVIVGGYATRSGNIKDMICIRYDATTGSAITVNNQSAENNSGDAFIKKVCTKTNGDVYFVAGEKGNSGNKQVAVGRIGVGGNLCWQRKIMGTGGSDILPSDIQTSGDEIDVISVVDSTIDSYLTTEYSELELDTATVYNTSGVPYWKKNEMIVKFLPSALDSSAIDNSIGTAITQFGALSYFMKPTAYSSLTLALIESCPRCDLKAVKIFPDLPTTFTSTTSRLGETIPVPDFWATLLVVIPSNLGMQQFCDALTGVAAYAHPNYIGQTIPIPTVVALPTATATGFDPYYYPINSTLQGQQSLDNPSNHNVDINAVEAWQVYPEGGAPHIKCGIFDQGVDWSHEDFGYDGTNPASSKVKGCWDFWGPGQDLKTVPHGYDSTGHGTSIGGIIGAVRNNTLGIKGIAGGNDTLNNNRGISLYGLKIGYTKGHYAYGFTNLQVNYLANAIVMSAMDNVPNLSYDYGLNISNNSWVFPIPFFGPPLGQPNLNSDTNIVLVSEAVHQVNRLNVTFVGAAGNDGLPALQCPTNLDDDWVIAVSGTGVDGNFTEAGNSQFYSNFGKGVDISAPSSHYNIVATNQTNSYWDAGGTSMACPHVVGVGGQLMSYNNDTLNPYNNLSPEDVEQIIQRSASPMPNGTALPNDSVGYGRLNAGKALRLIEKPCNKLWHFGTKYTSKTINKLQSGGHDTIMITERCHDLKSPFNYLAKGKYIVQAYEIRAFVNHNLPSTDTIKAFWPRPSYSDVWEKISNKKLRPHERDTILSCSNTQAQLRGYIYHVYDTLGNVLGWWPCDTSFSYFWNNSIFEYSILTSSCTITGIKKESKESRSLGLFPNPATQVQTIEIETDNASNLTIDLYDLMGRQLKRVYSGKTNPGKTSIYNDVGGLANSLYIYIIKINGEVITRKFIKE